MKTLEELASEVPDAAASEAPPTPPRELFDLAAQLPSPDRAYDIAGDATPDTVAEALRHGAAQGLTEESAFDNAEVMAQEGKRAKALASLSDAPMTAAWLSKPENMAIAKDDLENLSAWEKAFHPVRELGEELPFFMLPQKATMALLSDPIGSAKFMADMAKSGWSGLRYGTPQGLVGAAAGGTETAGSILDTLGLMTPQRAMARAFGTPAGESGVSDAGAAMREEASAIKYSGEQLKGKFDKYSTVQQGALSGAESLGQQLVPTIASFLIGNPAPLLAAMGVTTGGTAYVQAREQGLTPLESAGYGLREGGIEVGTGLIPALNLFKNLKMGSTFWKTMIQQQEREQLGEQAATALQDLNAWGTLPENKDKTIKDYLLARPEAAVQTAVATLFATSVQTGALYGVEKLVDHLSTAEQKATQQRLVKERAEKVTAYFQAVSKAAEAAKLTERSPEKAEELATILARKAGVETVYMPIDEFETYYQSAGLDPGEVWFSITGEREGYLEASMARADLAIPYAKYLAHVTPDEKTALDPHIRMRPDELTSAEAEKFAPEIKAAEAEAEAVTDSAQPEQQEGQDVYERARADLLATGNVSEDQAGAFAEVVRRRMVTRGKATGRAPMELYAQRFAQTTGSGIVGEGQAGTVVSAQAVSVDDIHKAATERGIAWDEDPAFMERTKALTGKERLDDLTPAERVTVLADVTADQAMDQPLRIGMDKYSVPTLQALAAEYQRRAESETGGEQERWQDHIEAVRDELASRQGAEYLQRARLPVPADVSVLGAISNALTVAKAEREEYLQARQPQTGTEAFKKWFGDSKVVDDSGKPLVVYHGTQADFSTFDQDNQRSVSSDDQGYFFISDPRNASEHAQFDWGRDSPSPNVMPVYLSLKNPEVIDNVGEPSRWYDTHGAKAVKRAMASGRDGLIVGNDERKLYVAFGARQIKSAIGNRGTFDPSSPNILKQDKRGSITFLADGGARLTLTKSMDWSTFLHEFAGHLFLDDLITDGTAPGASAQSVADLDAALEHMGLSVRAKDGVAAIRASVKTQHHELWATSAEAYFREGKAPIPELQPLFNRFKRWLLDFYGDIKALISQGYTTPLSDEVRAVFDRMLASQDAIDEAASQAGPAVLPIAEMRKLGVSESKLNNYAAALEAAKDKLAAKLLADLWRKKTAEYKGWLKDAAAAVTTEVEKDPVYQAIAALARGNRVDADQLPVALNRDELEERYAEEFQQQRGEPLADALKRHGITAKADAESLDLTALKLGFDSADEMVREIVAREPRSEFIDVEAQRRVEAEHPDALHDGTLEERAQAALHNSKRAAIIQNELALLAELAKEPLPEMRVIREAARRVLGRRPVADISPTRYLIAERKAANAAAKAAAAAKYGEALVAKRQQAMAAALYSEAQKARELDAKVRALSKKLDRRTFREGVAAGGQEFLIHLDQIRHVFGLRELSASRRSEWQPIRPFIDTLQVAGEVTAISDRLAARVDAQKMADQRGGRPLVPLDEYRELYEAMKNLTTIASQYKKVRRGKALADFETTVADLVAAAQQSGLKVTPIPVGERDKTLGRRASEAVGGLVTNLTRPEFAVEALDGGQEGPWHEVWWQAFERAQTVKQRLQRRLGRALKAAYAKMPKAAFDGLERSVAVLDGLTISRATLLAIVANTGNAGNLQRLTGAGVAGPGGVHQVSGEAVQRLRETLTDDELAYLQNLWDAVNSLLPDIEAHNREMSGVPMDKVEAQEFTVRGKTYRGGYFPIVYDWGRSEQGANQAEGDALQIIMAQGSTRAFTSKGYTQSRMKEVKAHLLFDYASVFSRHVDQVTTDIAYREAVKHLSKLLKDPRIRTVIRERFGDAGLNTLQGQLAYTVSASATIAGNVASSARALRAGLTANVAASALGFAVPLAAANYVSGLAQGVSRIGLRGLRRGLWNTYTNRFDSDAIIKAASPFLQAELESWDHEFEQALRKLHGERGFSAAYRRVVLSVHRWAQYEVSRAVWTGAYLNALDENPDAERAAELADKVIRTTQLAGGKKDVSTLERDPMFKDAMFFMAPMLVQFNALQAAARGRGATRTAGERLAAWMILGVLAPSLYMLAAGRGPDDGDDDELGPDDWVWWLAKNAALFPIQTLPLIGTAATTAESLLGGRPANPRASPAAQAIADMVKASVKVGRKVDDYIDGEEVDYTAMTQELASVAGPLTGVPASQIRRTASGIEAMMEGESEDANGGFVGLLIYGAPKP